MLRTDHGIDTLGIVSYLTLRIRGYETATGIKPTKIKLGYNRYLQFKEEAELLSRTAERYVIDMPEIKTDTIMGIPIIPAKHPDDITVESESEQ